MTASSGMAQEDHQRGERGGRGQETDGGGGKRVAPLGSGAEMDRRGVARLVDGDGGHGVPFRYEGCTGTMFRKHFTAELSCFSAGALSRQGRDPTEDER